jgi:hypothetical protein
MESIVIHAVSLESAQGFCSALEAFHAELVGREDGSYEVQVSLRGRREILAVLSALEAHVSQRGDGPARLKLGEQRYTLHPTDRPINELKG